MASNDKYVFMPMKCLEYKIVAYFLTGKPFDTSKTLNYATSNVISAIVYGSRFQYSDPQFKEMVNRANENIKISGSPSMQVPCLSKS